MPLKPLKIADALDSHSQEALEFVKKRRNCITPNEGFMEQLRIFDGALEASRNRELFTKYGYRNC